MGSRAGRLARSCANAPSDGLSTTARTAFAASVFCSMKASTTADRVEGRFFCDLRGGQGGGGSLSVRNARRVLQRLLVRLQRGLGLSLVCKAPETAWKARFTPRLEFHRVVRVVLGGLCAAVPGEGVRLGEPDAVLREVVVDLHVLFDVRLADRLDDDFGFELLVEHVESKRVAKARGSGPSVYVLLYMLDCVA